MKIRLLLIGLGIAFPALASDAPAAYGPLWQFAKDGRQHYLFGTIHVGQPQHTRLDNGLRCALQNSDTLALEIDTRQPDIKQQMTEQMAKVSPQRWQALHAPLRLRLEKHADKLGLNEQIRKQVPPGMVIIAYTMAGITQSGLSSRYGSEQVLSAQSANKPAVSLESAALQTRMLTDIPEKVIEESLDELDKGLPQAMQQMQQQLGDMMRSWEVADLAGLQASAHDPHLMATSRWMNELVLDKRNAPMADRIDQLAKGSKLFVAVGALHLPGEQGLIALLQRKGYQLQPVSATQRLAVKDNCQ